MKNSPGRKARRNLFFENKRRQGDLNRRSTHTMRTNMGMSNPALKSISRQDVLANRKPMSRWQRILAWVKNKLRRT